MILNLILCLCLQEDDEEVPESNEEGSDTGSDTGSDNGERSPPRFNLEYIN